MAAMAVLSTRSGQMEISRFGLRLFVAPHKQFINGQVEPFLETAGKASAFQASYKAFLQGALIKFIRRMLRLDTVHK